MPRRSPQLAIEGRVRSEEEYIAWAARVMRDAEDIRESVTEDRFKAHIRNKYVLSGNPDAADRQLQSLWDRGVVVAYQRMPEAQVRPVMFIWRGQIVTRYWDTYTKQQIKFSEVASRMAWLS